jgi:hypothetical protein
MFITKKRIWSLFIVLILGILQLSPLLQVTPARADDSLVQQQSLLTQVGNQTYGAGQKDVQLLAVTIIKTALTFLGLIFLVLLLWAGFKWMTAGGNETKIKESVKQIQNAAIGLIIILAAYGITVYIVKMLVCVTTSSGTACQIK